MRWIYEINRDQEKRLILPSQREYTYRFRMEGRAVDIANKIRQERKKKEKIILERKFIARSKFEREKISDKYYDIISNEFVEMIPKDFTVIRTKVERKGPPLRVIVEAMDDLVELNEWDKLLISSVVLERETSIEDEDIWTKNYLILEKAAKFALENDDFSYLFELLSRSYTLRRKYNALNESFANEIYSAAIKATKTKTIFGYDLINANKLLSIALGAYDELKISPPFLSDDIKRIINLAYKEKNFSILVKMIRKEAEIKKDMDIFSQRVDEFIDLSLVEKDLMSAVKLLRLKMDFVIEKYSLSPESKREIGKIKRGMNEILSDIHHVETLEKSSKKIETYHKKFQKFINENIEK